MSDDLLIICLVLVFLQEISCSGKCDLVNVLFHLICCHSQSIITDGNGFVFRTNLNFDLAFVIFRQICLSDQGKFLPFCNCIAAVADNLSQENVMVRIQPFFDNRKNIFRINSQITLFLCHDKTS